MLKELEEILHDLEENKPGLYRWAGGDACEDLAQLPYAVYMGSLNFFSAKFYDSEICDYSYGDVMKNKGWFDQDIMRNDIPVMSKSEVYSCITAIVREERFCEGTIIHFVENGILLALLKRLKEIEENGSAVS